MEIANIIAAKINARVAEIGPMPKHEIETLLAGFNIKETVREEDHDGYWVEHTFHDGSSIMFFFCEEE